MTQIAILSLWQNDSATVATRAAHLLAKTHDGKLRWLWGVGDSTDDTERKLLAIADANPDKNITVIRRDSGIAGEDSPTRLKRLGITTNALLDAVVESDGFILLHESDLLTPIDIISRFLSTGKCPVAGWPTLGIDGVFYDTWAYRKDGVKFINTFPYHDGYKASAPFEVDSFGSCWLAYAEDIRAGVRCKDLAILDLCAGFRALGRTLWVEPRIPVVQPVELWTSRLHA